MLVNSSAAKLRETIVKRVALEFKNGMYGILLFATLLRIIHKSEPDAKSCGDFELNVCDHPMSEYFFLDHWTVKITIISLGHFSSYTLKVNMYK